MEKDLSDFEPSVSRIKLVKTRNMVDKFQNLTVKNKNFVEQEEFPKLRKPKEATLQKIISRQKKEENVTAKDFSDNTNDSKLLTVPLRREFLAKKQEIEKSTFELLKKYETHKLHISMLDDMSGLTEEAKPLTLNKSEIDLTSLELNDYIKNNGKDRSECNTQILNAEINNPNSINKKVPKCSSNNLYDIMTYPEHLIYTIIYSKVRGHANGFFADNIPDWYRRTFDKDIASNWLEICKKSQQFSIENIHNKIVLYIRTKEDNEISDIDLNAAGDIEKEAKESVHLGTDSSVGFVRYKHLQKSLKEYVNCAGRKTIKSTNKTIKPDNKYKKINKLIK